VIGLGGGAGNYGEAVAAKQELTGEAVEARPEEDRTEE